MSILHSKAVFVMEKTLRRWEAAALLAVSIVLCTATWAQARQNSVSAKLVRLHVVAVSDDGLEQAIKLRVRDAVLEYLEPELADVKNAGEAKAVIAADMDGIAKAAASAAAGRKVTVSLGKENYPTREYEGMTLPAGRYDSLQVVLGAGEGHNWWCVVFPPLCLSAAEGGRMESVMGQEDFALVSGAEGYELRFKTVELWGELVNFIENRCR